MTEAETTRARVLIVEDDLDSREVMREFLLAAGHDVYAAADGIIGVSMARQVEPDVVVLDLGLPRMEGVEVGQRLRELLKKEFVLIAVTGWTDRSSTAQAGFDHHLVKPVDLDELRRLISGAVASSSTS